MASDSSLGRSSFAHPSFADWVLGSLSSGIVAIDDRGVVVMLNDGARRVLGCGEGALGRDCREVLRGQPAVVRLLLETLRGRRTLSRAELVLEDACEERGEGDRPESTIGFTLCPVHDREGAVRGAAMIFRDLTPFERGDEQERLRERLAALGQMAAGMAHEIRNPLAGMEVVAGLLRRRVADREEERELVDELLGELRRVAGTVASGLDFVRTPALARAAADPVGLVERALTVATARLPFSGTLTRDFAGDLPELFADAEQLGAVLTDVVVNALEAMGEAGTADPRLSVAVFERDCDGDARAVRVGADGHTGPLPASREVVIAVSDSGPGIPAELREKVFYPFFTTKQRGSGVGLANAQKVVASHGGSVELESRPGLGTTVRLCLPVETRADLAAETGPPRPEGVRA